MERLSQAQNLAQVAGLVVLLPAFALLVIAYVFSYRRMTRKFYLEDQDEWSPDQDLPWDDHELFLDEHSAGMIRRVQSALTPSETHLMNYYDGAMVLYLPADEVSGDFIYVEEVDGSVYLAVGDVGSSGAEGAVLTMACQSALSKVIHTSGYRDTSMLLHRLHQTVLETYSAQVDRLNFKLSMGLCRYDLQERVMEFSGAGVGMWMFRKARVLQGPTLSRRARGGNGTRMAGYNVREYRPANVNLGVPGRIPGFTTRIVAMEHGDTIYLATDGFIEQPGGTAPSELGGDTLRNMLCTLQREDMFDQRSILRKLFLDWRGEYPQKDDATLVGIRF